MRKIYIDCGELDGADGATGVILGDDGMPVEAVICGVRTYSMPAQHRDGVYDMLAECCSIEFVFDDAPVRAEFYPVPQLVLFACDGGGGCFCSTSASMDMAEPDAPIYYVNNALECIYLAPNLRALITSAVYTPGLLARAGVARPRRPLSYRGQQMLIERLSLRAADAADVRAVHEEKGIRMYRDYDSAASELEFEHLHGVTP